VFRVAQYLYNRSYWLDESSLAANVARLSPAGFFGPLVMNQLAPPGFLVAEWAATRAFGMNPWAMRLAPLLGGVASLVLVLAVARICLTARASILALALFAVADDLIYFASEAKQYSTDVALALACSWMGLTVGSRPLTAARATALAAAGAAVVWFSHPSIFVLASVGVVGLARTLKARDWRSAGLWMPAGLAWVASFAAVHVVAMEQLGHRPDMWAFWEFAFPPLPPRSLWDATWALRRVAFLFVSPLNFDAPFGPRWSMLPAFGLALVGATQLGKADRSRLALLLLPGAFALLASVPRLYPFHGRLLLFFTPSLLLLVAAGLDRAFEVFGRGWISRALLTMVLVVPAVTATYRLIEPRDRWHANPYGDRRPPSLDPYRFPF